MCGFSGFIARSPFELGEGKRRLEAMCQAIVHRGPDDEGYWIDESEHVAFGHRRLAVLDLSPAGAQPMVSRSGRWVLAFNGEIYNHLELRRCLEQCGKALSWRGHSDTETLLAGFDVWGIEDTVRRAVGMFAFAVWDREQRRLTLARDRLGEKPLYYGWQGGGAEVVFLFGSELGALRAHPSFGAEVNRDALSLYLRHNCIGDTRSIYSGIGKLAPGCLLSLSYGELEPVITTYWSAVDVAQRGLAQPFSGSAEEAVEVLDSLLRAAVRHQMAADVPLGAFLSGGVDSSTVVALMQAQSLRPVKTFSIGFHEQGYNEAVHAKAVARHLGTEHTELYVTPEQAMTVIPKLHTLYSEPFADSSQIPTYLVSQLARQHVTVSLSGDAGDELFCGYNRYQITARVWDKLARIPRPLRQLVARVITSVSPQVWNRLSGFLSHAHVGDKLHKGAEVMASRSVAELYRGVTSHWVNSSAVVIGCTGGLGLMARDESALHGLGHVERMMALDLLSYLPDDILVKVDRAAMGVSLETRVPFLDHRVVEFAWTLPLQYKLRDGVAKWPLRQVLCKYVPSNLVERPKMGFSVPIDSWLRGPMRDWAESLLDELRLRREGFFDPAPIRKKWDEHISGKRNWQDHLWGVLMFQAWLEQERRP